MPSSAGEGWAMRSRIQTFPILPRRKLPREPRPKNNLMIDVKNLTKAFGAKLAVNDVSFAVARGEVLGFLGPNGAGKSTTMRMITGFFPPSEGTLTMGGYDITRQPIADTGPI